jgi:hypothetical protein
MASDRPDSRSDQNAAEQDFKKTDRRVRNSQAAENRAKD